MSAPRFADFLSGAASARAQAKRLRNGLKLAAEVLALHKIDAAVSAPVDDVAPQIGGLSVIHNLLARVLPPQEQIAEDLEFFPTQAVERQ